MIKITYIPNKFEDTKVEGELPFNEEYPWLITHVADFADINKEYHHAICNEKINLFVDGKEIDVDKWNDYLVTDGMEIQIIPTIEGGNGGVLQTIVGAVLIVVGVVLLYTPAAALSPFLINAGAMLMLGGVLQMLVGTGDLTMPQSKGDSPTYSWEGIQLTSITDRPIGICYGEHMIGGNVLSAFVTSNGNKNYLNVLIGLCEGEIEGVMKADDSGVCTSTTDDPYITVNDQPLTNYSSDITWDYRVGTNTQTSIPGFNNTHTYYTDGRKITESGIIYTTELSNLNELQIRLQCPSLYKTTSEGDVKKHEVKYSVQYRLYGTTTWSYPKTAGMVTNPAWTAWKTAWKASKTNLVYTGSWYPDQMVFIDGFAQSTRDVWINGYYNRASYYDPIVAYGGEVGEIPIAEGAHPEPEATVWSEEITPTSYTLSACSKTTVRDFRELKDLSDGRYEIFIRRLSPVDTSFKKSSDLFLEGIDEITYNDLVYPNTALLALKMLATDQLSGGIPNIITKIRGKKIRVPKLTCRGNLQIYNNCYWNDTISKYIAPASYAGDNKCVIDTTLANWPTQWSQNPVWCLIDYLTNTRYGLGEYITDSLIDWTYALLAAKYADMYVDKLDGSEDTEKRFLCDGVWDSTQSGFEALTDFCRTFRAWVIWSEGKIKFIVDKAGSPVQLFNMSNIVTGSYSQTFASKSEKPNLIEVIFADKENDYRQITREVADQDAWTAGEATRKYTISLKGVTRQSQAVREAKFYLNTAKYRTKAITFKNAINAVHCQAGDVISFQHDVPQWAYGGRVVTASKYASTITLDSDVVITSGAYKLFFQSPGDVFTTATVTTGAGTHRTLTVSPTLTVTTTPQENAVWSFGAAGAQKKDFKILSVSRDKDNEIVISALEYNESVYSDTGEVIPTVEISDLPNLRDLPDGVLDLRLSPLICRPGFVISFNVPTSDMRFSYARILISTNGETFYQHSTSTTSQNIQVTGLYGQTYRVKVESCNSYGVCNPNNTRYASITLKIDEELPDVPGLELGGVNITGSNFLGKDCKIQWTRVSNSGYQVYYAIRDYRVDVLINGRVVHTEYTTNNWYIYTFEHNVADNGVPSPVLTFRVWVRGTDGKLSTNPAQITVTNPPPSPPFTFWGIGGFFQKINLYWSNSSDTDRKSTILYRGTVDNSASAVEITYVAADSTDYIDTDLDTTDFITTYYYWGKSQDVFNQLSEFSGGTSGQIGQIQNVDLAATLIAASNIRTDAIASIHIMMDAITSSKIVDDAIASIHIQTSAITETKITASAVTSPKIAALSIIAGKLAANSIVASNITSNAVTTKKIAALSITASKMAALSIVASHINAGAIVSEKLAVGAVVASTIGVNAVVAKKIMAGAVTAAKLSVATLAAITSNMGTVTINEGGYVRGGKSTYANEDPGFFLGYSISAYKFDIGDVNHYLRWDGTTLRLAGDIRTSTKNNDYCVLSASENRLYFYDTGGNLSIRFGTYSAAQNALLYLTNGLSRGAQDAIGIGIGIGGTTTDTGIRTHMGVYSTVTARRNTGAHAANVYNYGVWGEADSGYQNIAIYGKINDVNSTDLAGYFEGNVYCTATVSAHKLYDYTSFYEGDALSEIKKIKGKNGEIDHSTLPKIAYGKIRSLRFQKDETGKVVKNKHGQPIPHPEGSIEKEGRDIGGMVSVLTVGMQQLIDCNSSLERRIKYLEDKLK